MSPKTTRKRSRRRSPLPAADELRALLDAYDRANRLAIDAVYAQFSPTLDDYYQEELEVVFPAPAAMDVVSDELRPEIVLTRTVPGQAPKTVHGVGAAFPLARAAALAHAALVEARAGDADDLHTRLDRGSARLWPVQVPRTQLVQLRVRPDGVDLLSFLSGTAAAPR